MPKFGNDGRLTDAKVTQANNDSPSLNSTQIPLLLQESMVAVELGGSRGEPTTFMAIADAGNAANTETLVIGADTYEFVTAAGQVADDTYIGIVVGAGSGDSLDNLAAAINGTAAATGLFLASDATAPALRVGTESYYAARASLGGKEQVVISSSAVPGGDVVGRNDAGTAVTAAAVANWIFDCGNVDLSGVNYSPKNPQDSGLLMVRSKITAADITATFKVIVFPSGQGLDFVAGGSEFWCETHLANGTPVVRDDVGGLGDAFVPNRMSIFALGGGIAPNSQAGDILTVYARI